MCDQYSCLANDLYVQEESIKTWNLLILRQNAEAITLLKWDFILSVVKHTIYL